MKMLIFFIDALPFNLLKWKINLPINPNQCLPLKSILGFSESIRATIFSGTLPQKHKNWGTFAYDPGNTSFQFLKPLKHVDLIPISLPRRMTKFLVSKTLCVKEARKRGYEQLTTRNMPYSLLTTFSYLPKYRISTGNSLENIPTFFDILTSKGLRFLYLEWHNLGSTIFNELRKEGPTSDVVVIYVDHLDKAAHRYGLGSKKFINAMNEVIDIRVKTLKILDEIWGDYTNITFSDHGMIPVKRYVSLSELIDISNFPDKDLLVISGATYLRLWFRNEQARETTLDRLSKLKFGKILSEDEQNIMGVLFKQRKYFEELFLLEPGVTVFPNNYAWLKHKSMHGFDPHHDSQLACFEIDDDQFQIKNYNNLHVIDILPTILDILGLNIPETCEGSSIIK